MVKEKVNTELNAQMTEAAAAAAAQLLQVQAAHAKALETSELKYHELKISAQAEIDEVQQQLSKLTADLGQSEDATKAAKAETDDLKKQQTLLMSQADSDKSQLMQLRTEIARLTGDDKEHSEGLKRAQEEMNTLRELKQKADVELEALKVEISKLKQLTSGQEAQLSKFVEDLGQSEEATKAAKAEIDDLKKELQEMKNKAATGKEKMEHQRCEIARLSGDDASHLEGLLKAQENMKELLQGRQNADAEVAKLNKLLKSGQEELDRLKKDMEAKMSMEKEAREQFLKTVQVRDL